MTETEVRTILACQQAYFQTGRTLPAEGRTAALRRLEEAIRAREDEINAALRADLGKSAFEGYMCEVGLTLNELRYMRSHIRRFAREQRVRTPLAQYVSRSYKKPSPRGTVLIMSPWNYPFLLTMEPLIDAVAAGNTAVVKPSAYSPASSAVIAELIADCFPPEYVAVITGGRQENACLLKQKFDYIFFTGSQAVGREVLRCAAEHLTPVTLELGGKSPCIVDETAKLPLAARRIVFGKYLNCGQTCVAPDYVLCHRSVKDRLVAELKREITAQFGSEPLENPDYGRIINEKHFDRICGLIDGEKVVHGGTARRETLQISPTILDDVTWEDAVMGEEIFGPVLPVLTFDRIEEVCQLLAGKPKPLALYLFSQDRARIREVTGRCAFGGGCVNDVVIHLATSAMGFGGTGESGMGAYHGKAGFDTFSHTKSIVDKKTWLDLPMRYQPYKRGSGRIIRLFVR